MANPEPPDIRNWATLPWRVRLGGLVELIWVGATAWLLATGLAPAKAFIGLSVGLILLVVLFDSRRPWWPPEPTVPYDPLAANGHRWIVFACAVILVTIGLIAAGVLGV
jgi:hypothetical protein